MATHSVNQRVTYHFMQNQNLKSRNNKTLHEEKGRKRDAQTPPNNKQTPMNQTHIVTIKKKFIFMKLFYTFIVI